MIAAPSTVTSCPSLCRFRAPLYYVEAIADEFIQFKRMHYQVSRGSRILLLNYPLSSEEAAEHLADQVNRSVKGGAKYY
jgi:hypothetical protein